MILPSNLQIYLAFENSPIRNTEPRARRVANQNCIALDIDSTHCLDIPFQSSTDYNRIGDNIRNDLAAW